MKRRCILIPYLPTSPPYCRPPLSAGCCFWVKSAGSSIASVAACNERTLQRCPGSHRNNYKTSKPSCIRLRVECSTSQAVAAGKGGKERGLLLWRSYNDNIHKVREKMCTKFYLTARLAVSRSQVTLAKNVKQIANWKLHLYIYTHYILSTMCI